MRGVVEREGENVATIEQEPRVVEQADPREPGVAEVIEAVADLIEREGWIQGRAHTVEGYCVAGAIYEVAAADEQLPLRRVICQAITSHVGVAVEAWNDGFHRTKEEVVRTLREIAASEAERKGRAA